MKSQQRKQDVPEWEDFCGVCERNRTFTGRVESVVDVDEEGDHAEMSSAALGDEIAHSSSEQSPTHVREGEEEQTTSSKSIDRPDCRPGEGEVDETETEGS
jgi:hypothetical protein